ncbi:uncharacterized protein MYCFIDRAFT_186308 [Pseudocercospora fijiensis CIRAD86]|uniref:CT20 family protein n=1 Tax=Pseudocercospora fijiensis (strain CIRAD86) TaxID=383855 RepID=M3B943_PSEFD|nr:uncharacterized protein MYCFIDRAFT_186308 [Pseudocercospora fijiensis CIRAD86]EME85852.1 hypothetical protein MYCFIDRAFT_186308 [Pseudocercospora fijiensis CIRAD86]
MPPRKRARTSQATSPDPLPPSQTKTPTPAGSAEPNSSPVKDDEARLDDPWTDEEEIGLYKGMMRWKPTGIHKHFRLMALHAWLLENRYIHPSNAHTRPAGIWAKLNTLYDLSALDAREDARQLPKLENPLVDEGPAEVEKEEVLADADAYSEADNKIDDEEFDPSGMDGLEEDMWKRRLPTRPEEADEDGDSEPELPDINLAEEPPVKFMPSFSIEPSEAATPGSRKGKGGRRSTGKASEKGTRRSARQAESAADEGEGSEAEPEEGAEEGGEEENEDEEEGSEEESRASTPAPRSTRAKSAKGRLPGRGRGRGRGRK